MNLLVKSPVWDYLRETGLRIAAENPGAADRFLTAARESFELLRRHPRIGRLRSFSVPKTILHSAFPIPHSALRISRVASCPPHLPAPCALLSHFSFQLSAFQRFPTCSRCPHRGEQSRVEI